MTTYMYTKGMSAEEYNSCGYGIIIDDGSKSQILYGSTDFATAEYIELYAIVRGLQHITQVGCNICIITNCKYIVNNINNGLLYVWENNNWKDSENNPVPYADLWKMLLTIMQLNNIILMFQNHINIKKCEAYAIAKARGIKLKEVS